MYRLTSCLVVILRISLQNKEQLFCGIFTYFFVCIAPNLVYLHNVDINTVGIVNVTSVLLHLSHFSSICDTHLWSYKGSK